MPAVAPDITELLEAAPDGIVIVDAAGQITRVNRQTEAMFGYGRHELLGRPIEVLMPQRFRGAHVAHRDRYIQQPATRPMGRCLDLIGLRQDGIEFPVEVSLSPTQAGDEALVIGVIRDMTGHRRAEQLQDERDFIAAVLDTAGALVVVLDREGRILRFNSACEALSGYTAAEALGRRVWDFLLRPEDVAPVEAAFTDLRAGNFPSRFENPWVARDGRQRLLAWSNTALVDADGEVRHVIATGIDITDRRGAEEALRQAHEELEDRVERRTADLSAANVSLRHEIAERQRAETERDRLLASEQEKSEQLRLAVREAHHRIKNNLQAISDLLYLELHSGDGKAPDEALRDSTERIQTIALVHDLLSHEESVQTVDARAVTERLIPMTLVSVGLRNDAIETRLDMPTVWLSSKKATALALILNELVSNAAKHAFAPRQAGCLEVTLAEAEDGLRLTVRDDGPGLPAGFDLAAHANVGLEVARTLVERDLGGRLSLRSDHGLVAEAWFPW